MARYRIEEHLASGGMGEVYRARLLSEGGVTKKVALKLVREELARKGDFSTMFVDEARLAMTLSHANVVHAFDVGRVDARWFIAMEYVEGPTLGQLARAHHRLRGEPLPLRLSVTAMVEALKGLDYVHRRRDDAGEHLGLVHRDVSPGNVLVSREGEVKLTDFGIAKSEAAAEDEGIVKGKIAYMAPEQLRGERVDARADVYAAGVVLYELFAGRRAFHGPPRSSQLDLVPDVLAGRRPELRALRPDLDPELERIVDRAMSVDRSRRYESAATMRQDLETFAQREGWLLSTTDLADLLDELEEELGASDEAPAPSDQEARSHTRLTTFGEAVHRGDFDLRLGAELQKVSADEPVSIFVTGPAEGATRTAPGAQLEAPPPTTPQRNGVGTGALAVVLAVAVAVGAAAAAWSASGPEAADASGQADDEYVVEPVVEPVALSDELPRGADTPTDGDASTSTMEEEEEEEDVAAVNRPATMRRRRPAAMSTASGTLWVASDPWGWVFIDGQRVGRTTLRGHAVRAGRHEIVVRNPAGGLEARATVRVAAGETERVSLTLSEGGMQ